jgi:putative membrane protein
MIFYCIFGILAGIITGLVPGLHTNNVATFLLISPLFGQEFMIVLLSMSITHTFVSFIPSVFIGVPDQDTFESILPAHKLFLKGKAFEAICLTVLGGVIALLTSILFVPIFFIFIQQNNQAIIFITPIVLIIALIAIISSEKNKLISLLIIFSAASQGIFFNGQIFPLITGFFGLPTILVSIKKNLIEVPQTNDFSFNPKIIQEGIIGMLGGAIVSLMPGIGNNVAAALINLFRNQKGSHEYLVMLGSINTSNFFFSFAVLYAISKTRNGVMLVLQEKMFFIEEMLILGLIIMIISGCAAAIITIFISKKATLLFSTKKIFWGSILSIIIMVGMVGILNGGIGLIALLFSTATGTLAILKGVKRTCCMSALIIPSLFFYVFYLI